MFAQLRLKQAFWSSRRPLYHSAILPLVTIGGVWCSTPARACEPAKLSAAIHQAAERGDQPGDSFLNSSPDLSLDSPYPKFLPAPAGPTLNSATTAKFRQRQAHSDCRR